jgi:hypothetical protein
VVAPSGAAAPARALMIDDVEVAAVSPLAATLAWRTTVPARS